MGNTLLAFDTIIMTYLLKNHQVRETRTSCIDTSAIRQEVNEYTLYDNIYAKENG